MRAQGLRLFGHPVHAMLSDAPVALLGSSVVWDAAGLALGDPFWWAAGFWNIALGLAAAALAACAGLVDLAAIPERSPASRTALAHMTAALSAVALFGGSLAARGGPSPPTGARLAAAVALDALGLLVLSGAGWLGGHLVFHHGVGRDEAGYTVDAEQAEGGSRDAIVRETR